MINFLQQLIYVSRKTRHQAASHFRVLMVLRVAFATHLRDPLYVEPVMQHWRDVIAKAVVTGRARNAAAAASCRWVGGEGHGCRCADMVVE